MKKIEMIIDDKSYNNENYYKKKKNRNKEKKVFGSLTGYKRYGKIDCQGKKGGVVFGLAWLRIVKHGRYCDTA